MYRIIFRGPDFITIIFTIKSVNTYSHISANNKFHTVISTPWNFLESLASLPLVQESFLQWLKCWNGYPGLLFEVSLFPVRRIFPSSAGDNNLSDEDVVPIFRGKLYTSVRPFSFEKIFDPSGRYSSRYLRMKQNFDYYLIEALFRCWRDKIQIRAFFLLVG